MGKWANKKPTHIWTRDLTWRLNSIKFDFLQSMAIRLNKVKEKSWIYYLFFFQGPESFAIKDGYLYTGIVSFMISYWWIIFLIDVVKFKRKLIDWLYFCLRFGWLLAWLFFQCLRFVCLIDWLNERNIKP